jgi:hypothetical protein
MEKTKSFEVQFVEYMPEVANQGILYISMQYSVVIHLCACGCGEKVVTPLSPDDWKLTFDGTVSLYPSIGNWNFQCQSHYWIRRNEIIYAEKWDKNEVPDRRNKKRKTKFYNEKSVNCSSATKSSKKKWKQLLKSIFLS